MGSQSAALQPSGTDQWGHSWTPGSKDTNSWTPGNSRTTINYQYQNQLTAEFGFNLRHYWHVPGRVVGSRHPAGFCGSVSAGQFECLFVLVGVYAWSSLVWLLWLADTDHWSVVMTIGVSESGQCCNLLFLMCSRG